MSRFGCEFWSPNSEIFVMSFIGMAIAATEDPVSLWRLEFDEVWYMTLPSDKFSEGMETLIRIILLGLVTVRSFTAHAYIVTFMILLWPLFLEEHRSLITPWLVLSGLRNLLVEFVALVTGAFICYQYGCLSPHCAEFLIIKGISMSFSMYLWTSVAYFYSDLAGPNTVESHNDVLYNKKLELALRRRMCKSMADERSLRRRLMQAMAEDGETIRVSVSLEENVASVNDDDAIVLCRKRSLDSMMDYIQTDWDMMEFLIERRREEAEQLTLKSKAKAFLRLSALEIQDAVSKSKIRKRDYMANTGVQTDKFSKHQLEILLRKSTLPIRFDSSLILRSASESSLLPAVRKLSPMSYITMPPKFGYRHFATQTNLLSKKCLEDQLKTYYDEERGIILNAAESESSHSLMTVRKSKRVIIDESTQNVDKVNNVDGSELMVKMPESILKVKSGLLPTDTMRQNLNDTLLSVESQSGVTRSVTQSLPMIDIKPRKKESITHIDEEKSSLYFIQSEASNILEDLIKNIAVVQEVGTIDREVNDVAFNSTTEITTLVDDDSESVSSQNDGYFLGLLEHGVDMDTFSKNRNIDNEDFENHTSESKEEITEQRVLQVQDKLDDDLTGLPDDNDDVIEQSDHDCDVTESRDYDNDVAMSRISDDITNKENESTASVTNTVPDNLESSDLDHTNSVPVAHQSSCEKQYSDVFVEVSLKVDDSIQSEWKINVDTSGGKTESITYNVEKNVDVGKIKSYGVDEETQANFNENDSLIVLREKRRQRLEILEQKKLSKSIVPKLVDEEHLQRSLQAINESKHFETRTALDNNEDFLISKSVGGGIIPSEGLGSKPDSRVTFNRDLEEKLSSLKVGHAVSSADSIHSESESMHASDTESIYLSSTDSLGFNPIVHDVSKASVGTQASLNDGDSLKTVQARQKQRIDMILQQQRTTTRGKNTKDGSVPKESKDDDENVADGKPKNFVVGVMLLERSSQSIPFRNKANVENSTNKKGSLEVREGRLSVSSTLSRTPLQKINEIENFDSIEKSVLPRVSSKQGEAHLFRAEERNTQIRRTLGKLRSEELKVMWQDLNERESERELRIINTEIETDSEQIERYNERPIFIQGSDKPMHESCYAIVTTNSTKRLNSPAVDPDSGLTYSEIKSLYQKEFLASHPLTELALPTLGFTPTGKWSSDTLLSNVNEDDEEVEKKESFKKLHKTRSVTRFPVIPAPKKGDTLKKHPPPQKDMNLEKRYVKLYRNKNNQSTLSVAPDYSWLDVLTTKANEESAKDETVRSGEASEWSLASNSVSDDDEDKNEPTTSRQKIKLLRASMESVESFYSLESLGMSEDTQVDSHVEEKEEKQGGREPEPESYKGKGKGKGKSQLAKSPKEDESK